MAANEHSNSLLFTYKELQQKQQKLSNCIRNKKWILENTVFNEEHGAYILPVLNITEELKEGDIFPWKWDLVMFFVSYQADTEELYIFLREKPLALFKIDSSTNIDIAVEMIKEIIPCFLELWFAINSLLKDTEYRDERCIVFSIVENEISVTNTKTTKGYYYLNNKEQNISLSYEMGKFVLYIDLRAKRVTEETFLLERIYRLIKHKEYGKNVVVNYVNGNKDLPHFLLKEHLYHERLERFTSLIREVIDSEDK